MTREQGFIFIISQVIHSIMTVEHLWATSPKHKIIFYSVYLEFFHTSVFFAFTLSARVFKYPLKQATDVNVLELYMGLGVVAYAPNIKSEGQSQPDYTASSRLAWTP